MAEKVKKTRPELLKQRRSLAMFKRFLPTLILKKQQIQMEILKVRKEREKQRELLHEKLRQIDSWLPLLAESIPGPVTRLVEVAQVTQSLKNVAGIKLPVLDTVDYVIKPYSRLATPPWVDAAVLLLKELLMLKEIVKFLNEQERILKHELRKVTQRVNLFEKVMIPRAVDNIRLIRIALAEEQTAAVGRSKIAKAKSVNQEAEGAR